ncbi:molybdopterin molybdotransferase MoeA [uncultured Clostridium sp.]|uniref:molybdopterin molybdotransferase MoeA n=1 Tax=uncultured Clostridium sp. TaxID=59620 RepID=UPI002606EB05|nr:molybdopterin molybdotransferase MoeA [uncultured Clostridium sp.]
MKMEFFNSVSVEEAKGIIREVGEKNKVLFEEVSFYQATDRILYEDIISKENVPSFNRSRVDGYAVKFNETNGSSETMQTIFTLKDKVFIGKKPSFIIQSEECAYVPTGGEVPKGADAVVMIEDTDSIIDEEILVDKSVSLNENITLEGEDIKIGEVVLKKGTKLTPFSIGVLSSLGITKVKVFKRPRVGIISTGDEIVPIEKEILKESEIRDINSYALKESFIKLGCEISHEVLVKDNYEALKKSILDTIEDSDFILMSGGSSVGERDYMAKLLKELGEILFHGIRMKPGKPVLFGKIKEKGFFGLPGNPVSCLLASKLFVEEYIRTLTAGEKIERSIDLKLKTNLHSAPGKTTFVLGNIEGEYVNPLFFRSSMIKTLATANGYLEIDEKNEGLYKDSLVKFYLFD